MTHEAGKGSKPRPFSVSQEEYDKRWDAIFGRDLDEFPKQKANEDGEILQGKSILDIDNKVKND